MASLKSRSVGVGLTSAATSRELSHIITDVLYPSYVASGTSNKLLDGSTSHSGAFGTAQSDGKKYYYTNIKGSKPIKDPRIGAHFGSQRHMFTSGQTLEQESAVHDRAVKAIDGREWARVVGDTDFLYDSSGTSLRLGNTTGDFFEITGYFNAYNSLNRTGGNSRLYKVSLDGVVAHASWNPNASVDSPNNGRFVPSFAVRPVDLTAAGSSLSSDTTLGIHTIKLEWVTSTEANNYTLGFEFIAQDTSNVNNIQIPSQNVVSFGKKRTVSGTPHYDPFNGFVNSTSLHSAFVDTATSIGLSTPIATHGAPWAISGTNNIRPYNGGRVVKWVGRDGAINTSVNMMPPNAQKGVDIGGVHAEITTPSATNTYLPAFSDDAIDHSLAEVAKTFHWREFGNGSANQGSTASGSLQDASMLDDVDDIAYVMDDGLTGLYAEDAESHTTDQNSKSIKCESDGSIIFVTFIGTGISVLRYVVSGTTMNWVSLAQNLPYGTHIVKFSRVDTNQLDVHLDGVLIEDNTQEVYIFQEFSFHQPKMPPIPEDAVVIADYMLMADFVGLTASGQDKISKGVRACSVSRDIFHDDTGDNNMTFYQDRRSLLGFNISSDNVGAGEIFKAQYPCFGSNFVARGLLMDTRHEIYLGDTDKDSSSTRNNDGDPGDGGYLVYNDTEALGINLFGTRVVATGSYWSSLESFEFGIPIHTSSHYQAFESPWLNELVGGDRNMEQTNLVVTAEGKTWDEVTRDTSYIGKEVVHADFTGTSTAVDAIVYFDDHRGVGKAIGEIGLDNYYNKDFAIANDRFICLVPGSYSVTVPTMAKAPSAGGGSYSQIRVRSGGTTTIRMQGHCGTAGYSTTTPKLVCELARGDSVSVLGQFRAELARSGFFIERN